MSLFNWTTHLTINRSRLFAVHSGDRQLAVDGEVQLTIYLELTVLKLKEIIGGLREIYWGRRRGQLAVTIVGGVNDV